MKIHLPDVRQRRGSDCGPACVLAVCRYYGQRLTRREVEAGLLTTDHHGTDPSAIEACLRTRGLRVLSGDMGRDDLMHSCRLGRPVICVTLGHYVVACGWHRGRVGVHDPETGFRWVKWLDFRSSWYDRHRWGAEYCQFGLAAWTGQH